MYCPDLHESPNLTNEPRSLIRTRRGNPLVWAHQKLGPVQLQGAFWEGNVQPSTVFSATQEWTSYHAFFLVAKKFIPSNIADFSDQMCTQQITFQR